MCEKPKAINLSPTIAAGRAMALLFLLLVVMATPALGSDRLNPDLLKSVLRIESAPDAKGEYEIGSGFLVSTTGDESGRLLLITNKHMIGDWNYADRNIQTYRPWINVFFYRTGDPSGQSYRASKINVLTDHGMLDSSKVHLHPEAGIDLVAIDVTDIANVPSEHIVYSAYARSYLLPFNKVADWQTTIGDDVIALGYPLGIRSLVNNYPIAKVGYLASIPGEEVSIPFPCKNRAGVTSVNKLEGKFLIVDGLIVPGNSGGPVVLVGGERVRRDPQNNQLQFLAQPMQNYAIGVVSGALGPSGLNVVVSSDYVLELIQSVSATGASQ